MECIKIAFQIYISPKILSEVPYVSTCIEEPYLACQLTQGMTVGRIIFIFSFQMETEFKKPFSCINQ